MVLHIDRRKMIVKEDGFHQNDIEDNFSHV